MTHDEMEREAWIVVLSGDSTYTGLTGCWFAMTNQDQVKALDSGVDVEDVCPAPRHDMQTPLEGAIDHGYFEEHTNDTATGQEAVTNVPNIIYAAAARRPIRIQSAE